MSDRGAWWLDAERGQADRDYEPEYDDLERDDPDHDSECDCEDCIGDEIEDD